jgi:hypothetical protein
LFAILNIITVNDIFIYAFSIFLMRFLHKYTARVRNESSCGVTIIVNNSFCFIFHCNNDFDIYQLTYAYNCHSFPDELVTCFNFIFERNDMDQYGYPARCTIICKYNKHRPAARIGIGEKYMTIRRNDEPWRQFRITLPLPEPPKRRRLLIFSESKLYKKETYFQVFNRWTFLADVAKQLMPRKI